MKQTIYDEQGGQALVQVTLMLLVLVLCVALAIDVGHLYGERARMQNAADAGALAGARAMCLGYDDQVVPQAYCYAVTENGADPDLTEISVDGNRVTVVAREVVDTYFLGLIGLSTVDVGAEAEAACGLATSGSGLWPIAFALSAWEQKDCGESFAVWDDDKILDCTVYDCDFDDDGHDDIVVGGDRGWLDFSEVVEDPYYDPCVQPGCGANELKCHILNDNGALIDLPKCIPGDSGVKAAAWHAADSRTGDEVRIPLYESIGCATADHTCPGGLTYWVTEFGCAAVMGAETIKLKPIAGPGPAINGKVISMTVRCDGCTTAAGGTDGTAPGPKDMWAVSLTK